MKQKKYLAYEVTKLVHGEDEATKAGHLAEALFGRGGSTENLPTTEINSAEIIGGMNILDLLVKTRLAPSKGEGRRLIQQGGIHTGDKKVETPEYMVKACHFEGNELIIKKGKKTYHKVILK